MNQFKIFRGINHLFFLFNINLSPPLYECHGRNIEVSSNSVEEDSSSKDDLGYIPLTG